MILTKKRVRSYLMAQRSSKSWISYPEHSLMSFIANLSESRNYQSSTNVLSMSRKRLWNSIGRWLWPRSQISLEKANSYVTFTSQISSVFLILMKSWARSSNASSKHVIVRAAKPSKRSKSFGSKSLCWQSLTTSMKFFKRWACQAQMKISTSLLQLSSSSESIKMIKTDYRKAG